jgi:hypothetical protein
MLSWTRRIDSPTYIEIRSGWVIVVVTISRSKLASATAWC